MGSEEDPYHLAIPTAREKAREVEVLHQRTQVEVGLTEEESIEEVVDIPLPRLIIVNVRQIRA